MQRVKVVKSKARREAELRRGLGKILEKLRRDKSVKLVLLFGSLARGEVSESSDIDLIVVKDTKKRFLDRLDELYKDIGVAADILVYTPEEFEKMKKRFFIKKALEEGGVLYEA